MGEQFIPLTSIAQVGPIVPTETLAIYNIESARQMGILLNKKGLMTGAGVVQGDIAAATYVDKTDPTVGSDRPLCEYNCDIQGGYRCIARRSANPGLSTKGLAPAELLIQSFINSAQGIRIFNRRFIQNGSFDRYCEVFAISEDVKAGISYNLLFGKITANVFGGNSEIHPQALGIAKGCHDAGMVVNLTTTAGMLLSDSPRGQKFLQELCEGNVDVLAVTGEFNSAEHVRELAAMNRDQLKQKAKQIPFELGQVRKGLAAVHAAQLQEITPHFPQVLFNIVVHPGNINQIEEILATLKEIFPHAELNPYPAQSSMYHEPPIFSSQHFPALQAFITNRLTEQKSGDPHMILRPHYYAMLAAILKQDEETALRMFSGEAWTCYNDPYDIPGAGSVMQFGASPKRRNLLTNPYAGTVKNCFWEDTTTLLDGKQVWKLSPDEIADDIDGSMHKRTQHIDNPCAGCIMPRLTGSLPILSLGLKRELKEDFQKELQVFLP